MRDVLTRQLTGWDYGEGIVSRMDWLALSLPSKGVAYANKPISNCIGSVSMIELSVYALI